MKRPAFLEIAARSRAEGKGRPLLAAAVILASFTASGWLYFHWSEVARESRIAAIGAAGARLLDETASLRVQAVSRGEGSLIVRATLFDMAGADICAIERVFPDGGIHAEFLLVPYRLAGATSAGAKEGAFRTIAFPLRVSAGGPSSEGTVLLDSYDQEGFPAILCGREWGEEDGAAIVRAFAAARRAARTGAYAAGTAASRPGSILRASIGPLALEPGEPIDLVCGADGALSARRVR